MDIDKQDYDPEIARAILLKAKILLVSRDDKEVDLLLTQAASSRRAITKVTLFERQRSAIRRICSILMQTFGWIVQSPYFSALPYG